MNATQCIKARTLLGWSQAELGRRSSTSETMVALVEAGEDGLNQSRVCRIRQAITKAGILLLDGDTVAIGDGFVLPAPAGLATAMRTLGAAIDALEAQPPTCVVENHLALLRSMLGLVY